MTSGPAKSDKPAEVSTEDASRSKRRASVAPRSIRGRIVAGVLIIIPLSVTAFLMRFVYNAALAVGVQLVYWVSRAAIWAVWRVRTHTARRWRRQREPVADPGRPISAPKLQIRAVSMRAAASARGPGTMPTAR